MLKTLFTGRQLRLTLVVLAGVVVLCRLGIWQLDRLAQRHAQNALIDAQMAAPAMPLSGSAPIDPNALDYRRVRVRGVYDSAQEIVLRNRALDGVPGVDLITPLRLAGSEQAVLVDRGWVPLEQSAPAARRAFDEPGEVTVEGVARRAQTYTGGPVDPPRNADRPRLDAWFRVDIARIQQQLGYPVLAVFIEQQPAAGDPPLPKRVATTDLGEGPHLSYAIQWFAFATTLLVGYLAFVYQRMRRLSRQTG
jgi:surfeit locus 1 family protein